MGAGECRYRKLGGRYDDFAETVITLRKGQGGGGGVTVVRHIL